MEQGFKSTWHGFITSFYLSGDVFTDEEHFDDAADQLKQQLAGAPASLTVAVGDTALAFARKYRKELFGFGPLVFCAARPLPRGELARLDRTTGVFMKESPRETVEDILSLHPAASLLVILADTWQDRNELKMALDAAVDRAAGRISTTYPGLETGEPHTLNQEQAALIAENMPPNGVLLVVGFDASAQGTSANSPLIPKLLRHCQAPVYGLTDEFLGQGLAGGTLISGEAHGQAAAALVAHLLAGENTSSLPVRTLPNVKAFDLTVLAKYGISQQDLPDQSQTVNPILGQATDPRPGLDMDALFIGLCAAVIAGAILFLRKRMKSD